MIGTHPPCTRRAPVAPAAPVTQLALGGAALGLAFGVATLYWMALASHKMAHGEGTVQVMLTLISSYACFYVAENVRTPCYPFTLLPCHTLISG